jgi:ATP phosphoribosyltransferase regulatory subunit
MDEIVKYYNASIFFDQKMYNEDIDGSIAHVTMLAEQGIVTKAESEAIIAGLEEIRKGIAAGEITFNVDDEDIHMGIESRLIALIGEKNLHGLTALCSSLGIDEENAALLKALVSVYGPMDETLAAYEAMMLPPQCEKGMTSLRVLCGMLKAQGIERVNLDFSVVNDMNYYSGLIFSGFIAGIPSSVLSGGRYDQLMRRMGRQSDAIGFAVYLDQLERLGDDAAEFDVDVLILTDGACDPLLTAKVAKEWIDQGLTVRVQKKGGAAIRAAKTIDLSGEGAKG